MMQLLYEVCRYIIYIFIHKLKQYVHVDIPQGKIGGHPTEFLYTIVISIFFLQSQNSLPEVPQNESPYMDTSVNFQKIPFTFSRCMQMYIPLTCYFDATSAQPYLFYFCGEGMSENISYMSPDLKASSQRQRTSNRVKTKRLIHVS